MRNHRHHIPKSYISLAVLGYTDGPWPMVSPGSGLTTLSFGAGLEVADGYSPTAALGSDISLGSGFGLNVGVGEDTSAGPLYLGTHAVASDGAVRLTLPDIDMTEPITVVARLARTATSSAHRIWSLTQSSDANYFAQVMATSTATVITSVSGSSGVKQFSSVTTGTFVLGALFSGGTTVSGSLNGGAWQTGTVSPAMPDAAGPGYLLSLGAGLVCAAGVRLREIAFYAGASLSDANISALYNGGTAADMRLLIATQPSRYYDLSNFYDSGGGVWKVRDLITTDGTTDGTVVGGDDTDFVAV